MSNISYLSGGLLGDFIFQLSVINENYIDSGKKGILYLSNKGEAFRNNIEDTFKDIYNIIKNQEYILDFKIFNNESTPTDVLGSCPCGEAVAEIIISDDLSPNETTLNEAVLSPSVTFNFKF